MPESHSTTRVPATQAHAPDNARPFAPGVALRDYAVAELDSAIVGLGWRGGRVHAGVHQARKALRRVRATLALGGTALGPGAALLDRELRKANRGLSALRDVQALVETLDRLIAAQSQSPSDILQPLRRARRIAAARRAIQARAALAGDPQLISRRDLLVALRGAMLASPWQRVDLLQVQSALDYGIDRIARAQARAQGSHDDEDWHRWRRRERRLSQQRRALKAGGIAHAVDLPKADKRIATRLGGAQDLGLLREHCGRDSPFTKPDRVRLKRYADVELTRQRAAIAALGAGRRESP